VSVSVSRQVLASPLSFKEPIEKIGVVSASFHSIGFALIASFVFAPLLVASTSVGKGGGGLRKKGKPFWFAWPTLPVTWVRAEMEPFASISAQHAQLIPHRQQQGLSEKCHLKTVPLRPSALVTFNKNDPPCI